MAIPSVDTTVPMGLKVNHDRPAPDAHFFKAAGDYSGDSRGVYYILKLATQVQNLAVEFQELLGISDEAVKTLEKNAGVTGMGANITIIPRCIGAASGLVDSYKKMGEDASPKNVEAFARDGLELAADACYAGSLLSSRSELVPIGNTIGLSVDTIELHQAATRYSDMAALEANSTGAPPQVQQAITETKRLSVIKGFKSVCSVVGGVSNASLLFLGAALLSSLALLIIGTFGSIFGMCGHLYERTMEYKPCYNLTLEVTTPQA